MKQETRSMIFVGSLCLLFFLGYNQYIKSKYPSLNQPRQQAEPAAEVKAGNAASPAAVDSAAAGAAPQGGAEAVPQAAPLETLPEEQLTFDTDAFVVKFDQKTASPSSIVLKNYKQENAEDSPRLDIAPRGLVIQAVPNAVGLYETVENYSARREGDTIHFMRDFGSLAVTQSYTLPGKGFSGSLNIKIENKGETKEGQNLSVTMKQPLVYPKERSMVIPIPGAQSHRPMFVAVIDGSRELHDIRKACEDADAIPAPPVAEENNALIDVAGFDTHHFMNGLIPAARTPLQFKEGVYAAATDKGSCPVALTMTQPLGQLAAGETAFASFKTYFGPKDNDVMEAEGGASLARTIDFGFFSFIAVPLLNALKFFYKHTGNYAWAIIIVTILLKLLFYPLQKQASISAHRMKKLQPQMTKLRERHKDDPRRMQQEMMKFMSENKVNPMKGCIPMLPTIPVFFAFFQVLSSAIELRHAPFMAWITDLSVPDPYYVTPILVTAAMFMQQKMTPMTGMDKTQQRVMLFLPIIFGVMLLTMPSGMTIYMFVNTVVQMAQMQWINRRLDVLDAGAPSKADVKVSGKAINKRPLPKEI